MKPAIFATIWLIHLNMFAMDISGTWSWKMVSYHERTPQQGEVSFHADGTVTGKLGGIDVLSYEVVADGNYCLIHDLSGSDRNLEIARIVEFRDERMVWYVPPIVTIVFTRVGEEQIVIDRDVDSNFSGYWMNTNQLGSRHYGYSPSLFRINEDGSINGYVSEGLDIDRVELLHGGEVLLSEVEEVPFLGHIVELNEERMIWKVFFAHTPDSVLVFKRVPEEEGAIILKRQLKEEEGARIVSNLRQIAGGAMQYMLETDADEVRIEDIVGPGLYVRVPIESIRGESYDDIVITPDTREISVETESGEVYRFEIR